jgi:hypothetical protein
MLDIGTKLTWGRQILLADAISGIGPGRNENPAIFRPVGEDAANLGPEVGMRIGGQLVGFGTDGGRALGGKTSHVRLLGCSKAGGKNKGGKNTSYNLHGENLPRDVREVKALKRLTNKNRDDKATSPGQECYRRATITPTRNPIPAAIATDCHGLFWMKSWVL